MSGNDSQYFAAVRSLKNSGGDNNSSNYIPTQHEGNGPPHPGVGGPAMSGKALTIGEDGVFEGKSGKIFPSMDDGLLSLFRESWLQQDIAGAFDGTILSPANIQAERLSGINMKGGEGLPISKLVTQEIHPGAPNANPYVKNDIGRGG